MNALPKAELDRIVQNYVDAVHTLCRYEAALHRIANMGRDTADDAHTIAREALAVTRAQTDAH